MHTRQRTWWCSAIFVGAAFIALTVVGGLKAEMPASSKVEFDASFVRSEPIKLEGQLRPPGGTGPFPAVVLLHGCAGWFAEREADWATLLQSWGYVSLVVDSFGPRGITNICGRADKRASVLLDGYAALHFLARQPYVDASKVVLMGFSMGGAVALATVEQGWVERLSDVKFRAAVAFYPPCEGASGITTVPTLVLIGESDDWTRADACQKMAAGRSELGTSRADNGDRSKLRVVVYPGAYHGFDNAGLTPGRSYLGHWVEYNAEATRAAVEEVRAFLAAMAESDRK